MHETVNNNRPPACPTCVSGCDVQAYSYSHKTKLYLLITYHAIHRSESDAIETRKPVFYSKKKNALIQVQLTVITKVSQPCLSPIMAA
jgi:hypothetical protein